MISMKPTNNLVSISSSPKRKSFNQEATTVVQPIRKHDVLLGRTKLAHGHDGNKFFRMLVQERSIEYKFSTSREVKRKLTYEIIAEILRSGGRFLNLDDANMFHEISSDARYEKVSHALRSARVPGHSPSKAENINMQTHTVELLAQMQRSILRKEFSSKETSLRSLCSLYQQEKDVEPPLLEPTVLNIDPLPLSTREISWDSDESVLEILLRDSFLIHDRTNKDEQLEFNEETLAALVHLKLHTHTHAR